MSLSSFWYYYNDDDEVIFRGISRVTVDIDSDGNLVLRARGRGLPRSDEYEWIVTADGNEETYTTTGPTLTFTAEQTEQYKAADELTVQILVMETESQTFDITISKYVVGVAIAGIAIAA